VYSFSIRLTVGSDHLEAAVVLILPAVVQKACRTAVFTGQGGMPGKRSR